MKIKVKIKVKIKAASLRRAILSPSAICQKPSAPAALPPHSAMKVVAVWKLLSI